MKKTLKRKKICIGLVFQMSEKYFQFSKYQKHVLIPRNLMYVFRNSFPNYGYLKGTPKILNGIG